MLTCYDRQPHTVGGRPITRITGSGGSWLDFFAGGDWVISSGSALHLPTRVFAHVGFDITASAFVPNGDVLAGSGDGSLVRFCLD